MSLYYGQHLIPYVTASSKNIQSEKAVAPTKSEQVVVADDGYDGMSKVIVSPIPDEYITTSDATAVASDVIFGRTTYSNGEKITGTLVIQKYYTGTDSPSSELGNNGDIYFQE